MDLDDLIRTRLLIQGNSGSGKSYLLKRICEQSHNTVQQIIVDLEGEFAPLREQFDYVLMGPDGDVPVQVKYAKILAQRIMELAFSAIIKAVDSFQEACETFKSQSLEALNKPLPSFDGLTPGKVPEWRTEDFNQHEVPPPRSIPSDRSEGGRGALRKVLQVLVEFAPMKMTRSQLAIASGYRVTSGHFKNTLSKLYQDGLMDRNGGEYWITDAGLSHFGKSRPHPRTADEIIQMWRAVLPKVALKIFDLLMEDPGKPLERDEIARLIEYSASSGHFKNNISVLTRNRLIKKSGPGYVPNEELWRLTDR